MFKKGDVLSLVQSNHLIELFTYTLQSKLIDRRPLFLLLGTLIETVLDFKDREAYDALSLSFLHASLFPSLLALLNGPLQPEEHRSVARVLELCACHPEGIGCLGKCLRQVVEWVELFMDGDGEERLVEVKYPAATVLLDLTANEGCIERVA